ncbi:MAG: hypothetical protein H6518_01180 [Microthrixaceae bacterium]|nr:hypothetical protein [Microthrixaceae bacterium]
MDLWHNVKRFFGSLRPGPPPRADLEWAEAHLLEGEVPLWRAMSNPDKRHALRVARRVDEVLGATAPRPVMAAALLHDVGKNDARLRTYGRVVATLTIWLAGKRTVAAWTQTRGLWRRIGLYAEYPRLGSEALALAGSDPLTVAWALEHHDPPEDWTVPHDLGEVLAAADE